MAENMRASGSWASPTVTVFELGAPVLIGAEIARTSAIIATNANLIFTVCTPEVSDVASFVSQDLGDLLPASRPVRVKPPQQRQMIGQQLHGHGEQVGTQRLVGCVWSLQRRSGQPESRS